MTGMAQVPTDNLKLLSDSIKFYLAKQNPVIELFDVQNVDSADKYIKYVRQIQTYSATKGWTSFDDPLLISDNGRPPSDGIGTEDGSATMKRYGLGFDIDAPTLKSGKPIVQQLIGRHMVEKVDIIKNYVERALLSDMSTYAAQSYTETEAWNTTGAPENTIIDAQTAYKLQAGGQEADFLLLHPYDYREIAKTDKFQNTLYVNEKSLETGKISPKPFGGLDIIQTQAATRGTFYMGKKGMFGSMYVSENFASYETDNGAAGMHYEIVHRYCTNFVLPYYLMKGTGIYA